MATSVAASASASLALGSVPTRSRPRRRRRGVASLVPGGTRDDDARHRHRRWRVAPDVDGVASPCADLSIERPRSNAPSDALERLLATRFATLGDAIRAPPNEREAIERSSSFSAVSSVSRSRSDLTSSALARGRSASNADISALHQVKPALIGSLVKKTLANKNFFEELKLIQD